MAARRFYGGVHPAYNKDLADKLAIETMPVPKRLIVPFAQNLGAAPKPVVKKGDTVKKGQIIAEPQGFVSVPLHAPTSGTVQAIDVFPHPVGADMPAAVIVPDGRAAQKLRQAGLRISKRSVDRIFAEFGLQKKTLPVPARPHAGLP